jgi:L-ascorbate metabolism protein UlaG (beta-lactamase superfamily)
LRRLTWLGHATVLLELGGARLLTDPVLRHRVAHLQRRVPDPDVPGDVDAVLISHVHRDHLDRPSLKPFAGTPALAPRGAAPMLEGLDLREVAAGDTIALAGVEIAVVRAWHEARRRPGAPALDALGFLAEGVWFAGDTDLDDEMAELQGRVDVALLPVWGWGPSLGPGHMDPQRAARAVALVRPRLAIPIHWGTFLPYGSRRTDLLSAPPRDFARYAGALAPLTEVTVLSPGDSLAL